WGCLAFNFAEIYKIGPMETKDKLLSVQINLKKIRIDFEWKALASSKLVHSKGYAIIQRVNGKTKDGVVLITSANFTNPGFTGGNIELGYISTKKLDLKDFEIKYDYLWDEVGTDISTAVFKQNNFLFKFALLSSGVFIHKWSGSLRQQVGIKYELTELAKEKGTIAPELAAVGFEAGDTFTRQVLNLSELPPKEVPSSFIKRFTIETYWGRWCPADAWKRLSRTFEGSEGFIEEFQSAVEEKTLLGIKDDAYSVQEKLVKQGLIKKVKEDHLNRWVNRVQELSFNVDRLERIFTGYEVHKLPYSIEQKSDIIELFESLEETVELSKAKNIAKEKIMSAIISGNLNFIKLTSEEKMLIDEM
ncbi:MAG: hypothetical protein D3923_08030, partial [Candidatus Electrothrix sp. AR3]|nr:hypothetical protein [Candidatus Electrothrix sp. AR3]